VVTCGRITSYDTEAISDVILSPWHNWQFYRRLPRHPGFESRGRYPEIEIPLDFNSLQVSWYVRVVDTHSILKCYFLDLS